MDKGKVDAIKAHDRVTLDRVLIENFVAYVYEHLITQSENVTEIDKTKTVSKSGKKAYLKNDLVKQFVNSEIGFMFRMKESIKKLQDDIQPLILGDDKGLENKPEEKE